MAFVMSFCEKIISLEDSICPLLFKLRHRNLEEDFLPVLQKHANEHGILVAVGEIPKQGLIPMILGAKFPTLVAQILIGFLVNELSDSFQVKAISSRMIWFSETMKEELGYDPTGLTAEDYFCHNRFSGEKYDSVRQMNAALNTRCAQSAIGVFDLGNIPEEILLLPVVTRFVVDDRGRVRVSIAHRFMYGAKLCIGIGVFMDSACDEQEILEMGEYLLQHDAKEDYDFSDDYFRTYFKQHY